MGGTDTERAEIAVIGAGPCGIGVGIAARSAGLSCTLFDKGCVAGSIGGYPTFMTFFSTAERLEIGGVPFTVAGDKPVRREALRYYQRLADHFDLDVRQYHTVESVEGSKGGFRLGVRSHVGQRRVVEAANVVIATGYFDHPNHLGVPGEDLPKVTLIHFEAELDRGVKPWVRPDMINRMNDGSIEGRFRSRIQEIRPATVVIRNEDAGETEEIENDWVLTMTGYTPDPKLLRSLGVRFDPATGIPTHDPATMRTNVDGVFIAGVLAAGNDANKVFIENGRDHGSRIVASLLEQG